MLRHHQQVGMHWSRRREAWTALLRGVAATRLATIKNRSTTRSGYKENAGIAVRTPTDARQGNTISKEAQVSGKCIEDLGDKQKPSRHRRGMEGTSGECDKGQRGFGKVA